MTRDQLLDKSMREKEIKARKESKDSTPSTGLFLKLSDRKKKVKGWKTERETERSEKSHDEERRKEELLARDTTSSIKTKKATEKQTLEKRVEELKGQNDKLMQDAEQQKQSLRNAKEELLTMMTGLISIQETILKSKGQSKNFKIKIFVRAFSK